MGRIIDTINYVIDGTEKNLIKSIGIGSPGPLDVKNGVIIENSNLIFLQPFQPLIVFLVLV